MLQPQWFSWGSLEHARLLVTLSSFSTKQSLCPAPSGLRILYFISFFSFYRPELKSQIFKDTFLSHLILAPCLWRVAEHVTPKQATWYIDCFEFRPLKNSLGLSLNSPYLPKDKSSKRILLVLNCLPGGGEDWLSTGEVTRGGCHSRQALLQMIKPFICSDKGPCIFPKNHLLFSPKGPVSLLPSPY